MKLILAIIQPSKLEAVKEALNRVEVVWLTIVDVQGFGRQKGHSEVYGRHELFESDHRDGPSSWVNGERSEIDKRPDSSSSRAHPNLPHYRLISSRIASTRIDPGVERRLFFHA